MQHLPDGDDEVEIPRPTAAPALGLVAALASLLAAACALAPNAAWAWLTLPLGVAAVGLLARTAPTAALLFAPLLLLRASELVSIVAIESGATMTETMTRGHPTGAASHLFLLSLATLAFPAALVERLVTPAVRASAAVPISRDANRLAVALATTLAIATLVLASLGLKHGVPLIGHVDRFTYLKRLEGTAFPSLIHNSALLGPFIGVVLAVPTTRRCGLLLLCWLLALSILFGEKFTSLLLILGGAAIAPSLASTRNWRPLLLAGAMLGSFSLPAILVTYGARDDARAAMKRFVDRAAVQGQLFYLADRLPPPSALDTPALTADMATWSRPAEQSAQQASSRFGLYYVMARFTPSHRLKLAQTSGGGFVFPLFAYFLLAGGPFLLVLGALTITLVHGLVLALLARALLTARWLAALAFARLLAASYATLTTGYLWNMFGVKSLATLAVGIFLLRFSPGKNTVHAIPVSGSLRTA